MCVAFRCNFEVSPQFISTSVGLLKANILMAFKPRHTHEHKQKKTKYHTIGAKRMAEEEVHFGYLHNSFSNFLNRNTMGCIWLLEKRVNRWKEAIMEL